MNVHTATASPPPDSDGFMPEGTAFEPPSNVETVPLETLLTFLRPSMRTMLFIDGANTYMASRQLGFNIDYRRLREAFADRCDLIRAYYFTALPDSNESRGYNALRPLMDWMGYHQYSVVSKPLKFYSEDSTMPGRPRWKGNMDVELTIEVMQQLANIDTAIIFSGDGDFRKLVETCKDRGKRTVIVSTLAANPQLLSDELRRAADYFVDLASLMPHVERKGAPRSRRTRYVIDMQPTDATADATAD